MGRAETLKTCLKDLPVNADNGTDWYRWLFTQAPDTRKYFVGAANIEPAKVKESERFQKQGQRFLTRLHEMAAAADDEEGLRKICYDLADGHKRYKVHSPEIYQALGGILMEFIGTKMTLTPEQRAEFDYMLGIMNEEAKKALAPK